MGTRSIRWAVLCAIATACGSNGGAAKSDGAVPDTSADAKPDPSYSVQTFDTHCLGTPDPDVAAGPDLVGTAIQWNAYFYRKDGTPDHTYTWTAAQGSLVSDTHIVYDPTAARWLISTIVSLGGGSYGVQVMTSSDQTATTWAASVPIMMPRLIDNPQPTVTADKVVFTESGPCVWVLDKTPLFAGNAPEVSASSCSLAQDNQVAGVKAGAPAPMTAYAITMADASHLNWISVDGTQGAGNVTVVQHQIAVPIVNEVPTFGGITQYGQGLESGQVKAMWQNGKLVWAKTVNCATGTCTRLFTVDTGANTATSHDFGLASTQLFFGVPGLDSVGDTWLLAAAAPPAGAVGLALAGIRASGAIVDAAMIVSGQSQLSGNRFGDFFSAAQDPSDGSTWLIGQYASTSNPTLNPENTAGCKVVHVQLN
jgi:hypothetical protein